MHRHQKRRVGIALQHVVDGVLIEIEPQLAEILETPVVIIQREAFVIKTRRLHLPFPPADVVLMSGQHDGCVRLRTGKVLVAPMGGEKTGHPRVVDLKRQHQTRIIVRIDHHSAPL